MIRFIIAISVVVVLAFAVFKAFRKPRWGLEIGGIYSIDEGNGLFGIVKLLVRADGICHVRVYKQKFSARPVTIDLATLSLGQPGDPDGFGMGHIPLLEAGFLEEKPMLITKSEVTSEEMEGYKMWKESSGGAF
jgi:hypothetical protein